MKKKTSPPGIEVEVRGSLTKAQRQGIETLFKKQGKFKEKRERILIDYSTFLPNEALEGRTRDIRLRVTNGVAEIIVKLGTWGGEQSRTEFSVPVPGTQFDTLVQLFAALGFIKGVLAVRNSVIYDFKGIEFALVEVPGHSFFFEAEKMVRNAGDVSRARESIGEACATLGLSLFDDVGWFAYMAQKNREANEVFDFKNYQDGYFKKRFRV